MYRAMRAGFLDVVIGPPAEIGGTDRCFDDLPEARSYLRALVDDDSERVALRELVLDGGGTMMLTDDGVLADAAQRLLDGRLGVREASRLTIGTVRRDGTSWVAPSGRPVPAERPSLAEILRLYQQPAQTMVEWSPIPGIGTWIDSATATVTETEARLLEGLSMSQVLAMDGCASTARLMAREEYAVRAPAPAWVPAARYEEWIGNDGHLDALRHSLWNALMTVQLGEAFAESFATAHEGAPRNPPTRMAMDLWNNAQGRAVARANPRATPQQLKIMLLQKIGSGDLLVLDAAGNLAWSNTIERYQHGLAPVIPP